MIGHTAQENIAVVRRYFEEYQTHNRNDIIQRLLSQHSLEHPPNLDAMLNYLHASLQDLRFSINAISAHGDYVELLATAEAVAPSMMQTTVHRTRIAAHHTMRVRNGRIIEHCGQPVLRLEYWDSVHGWQPVPPNGSTPSNPKTLL